MTCYSDNTDSDEEDTKPKFKECTDVLWLCIFISFCIIMIFLAAVSYVYGNPVRLISGTDTFGNICGSDNNEKYSDFNLSGISMREKPYLFYMDINNMSKVLRICVKQCPDRTLLTVSDIEYFHRKTGSSLCRYDVDIELLLRMNTSFMNTPVGPCPQLPVEKSVLINNRCIPESYISVYLWTHYWSLLEQLLRDLYVNWSWILGLTLLSFIFSIVLLTLIHIFARIISWIIMISFALVSFANTGVLWWTYINIKCKLDSVVDNQNDEIFDEDVNNEEAFIWYSCISSIFMLLLLLTMFSMRKHISFLVALFQESSACLSELPILYLQPVLSFLLLLAFYIFWISVIICLATASYPETKNLTLFSAIYHVENAKPEAHVKINSSDVLSYTIVEFTEINWLKYTIVIYVIGLIWISNFILACQHMVVAGSVAKWYFNRNTKSSTTVVLTTMGNLICYHVGSIAFGSLLITLLKVPRIILAYIYKNIRRNEEDSDYADYVTTCCSCCFCCFKKFVQHVNHNAYAIIAVHGTDFCPAAYRSFKMLADNALQLTTVNGVGNFILFLAKCLVTFVVTVVAVLIFKFDSYQSLFAASTFIVYVFTYFIAHAVISLHEVVIDTMFLCISQDHKANGNDGQLDGQWRGTLLATMSFKRGKSCHLPPPLELQRAC